MVKRMDGKPGTARQLGKTRRGQIVHPMSRQEQTPATHHLEVPIPLGGSAVRIFAVNERMNQALLGHLNPAAWNAKPPGKSRTIAAIFTHLHNVRCKWIRLTAAHLTIPALLNRAHCTPEQARAALAESAAGCERMLAAAFAAPENLNAKFLRDGWARPWPVGPEMLCYMLAHEAHHRGQVLMLAHQLGFPLPRKASDGIWNWEMLWKECGFPGVPGNGI